MPKPEKFHLVLAGGGMKAISYVGCLEGLIDHGIKFASISGCSSGAIVGASISAGISTRTLEHEVQRLTTSEFRGKMNFAGPLAVFGGWPRSIYRRSGVVNIVNGLMGTGRTMGSLDTPFATLGVDMVSKQFEIYSSVHTPEFPVSEALEIATALPGLYPPHESKGKLVVDGALASACPVWLPLDAFSDEQHPILAVMPKTTAANRIKEAGFGDWLATIIELGATSRDSYLIGQMPGVHSIEIDTGDVGFFEFAISKDSKDFLISSGKRAAETFVADLDRPSRAPDSVYTQEDGGYRAESAQTPIHAFRTSGFLSNPAMGSRVFISYSHKDDSRFVDHLRTWLRASFASRDDQVTASTYFTDDEIEPGQDWFSTIFDALSKSSVAILLVSPNYLASDFIQKHELPKILAAQEHGLRIIWIPVRLVDLEDTPLRELQAACNPENPLSERSDSEVDRVFRDVARLVRELGSANDLTSDESHPFAANDAKLDPAG